MKIIVTHTFKVHNKLLLGQIDVFFVYLIKINFKFYNLIRL